MKREGRSFFFSSRNRFCFYVFLGIGARSPSTSSSSFGADRRSRPISGRRLLFFFSFLFFFIGGLPVCLFSFCLRMFDFCCQFGVARLERSLVVVVVVVVVVGRGLIVFLLFFFC